MFCDCSSNNGMRIYGPRNLGLGDDQSVIDRQLYRAAIGSKLLSKIQSCYSGVAKHHDGVFDAAFCFGLLDPSPTSSPAPEGSAAMKVVPSGCVFAGAAQRTGCDVIGSWPALGHGEECGRLGPITGRAPCPVHMCLSLHSGKKDRDWAHLIRDRGNQSCMMSK